MSCVVGKDVFYGPGVPLKNFSFCSASFVPKDSQTCVCLKVFCFSIGKDKFHCFCDILDDYG